MNDTTHIKPISPLRNIFSAQLNEEKEFKCPKDINITCDNFRVNNFEILFNIHSKKILSNVSMELKYYQNRKK